MTEVKSAWATGNGLLVEDSKVKPGVEVTVAITSGRGHRGAQATVNRVDLIRALVERGSATDIMGTRVQHWKERAQRAEATVERVRALLPEDPKSYDHPLYEDIRAALDGVEQFELPTKTWSGIVGEHYEFGELELRLFPDGKWTHVKDPEYPSVLLRWKPDVVLENFTGLRLVED